MLMNMRFTLMEDQCCSRQVKDNDDNDEDDANNAYYAYIADDANDPDSVYVADDADDVDYMDDADSVGDAGDAGDGDNYNGDIDEVEVFADSIRVRNCQDTHQILFKYKVEVFEDSS